MRILFLSICFSVFTIHSFCQQFLWTTSSIKGIKTIPKEDVNNQLSKYFEFYDYYYDMTGYTKESFKKGNLKGGSSPDFNKSIMDSYMQNIMTNDSLSISAFKINQGTGSSIIVSIAAKNKFDLIVFSNTLEEGAIPTLRNWQKFISWFNSLTTD